MFFFIGEKTISGITTAEMLSALSVFRKHTVCQVHNVTSLLCGASECEGLCHGSIITNPHWGLITFRAICNSGFPSQIALG